MAGNFTLTPLFIIAVVVMEAEMTEKFVLLRKMVKDFLALESSMDSTEYNRKSRILVDYIIECICLDGAPEINQALYALSVLSEHNPLLVNDEELTNVLIRRIPELLKHKFRPVVYQVIDVYVWLRRFYPDFRDQMLCFLSSEDPGLRKRALFFYDTYSKSDEIDPLLCFENDNYAADVRMGGHFIYELRNMALQEIEKKLNTKFVAGVCKEPYQGIYVEWFDWTPFLSWQKRAGGIIF